MAERLNSARVPADFEPVFAAAEKVVASFFGSRTEDPTRGIISISGERYVLVRAASLSVEFFTLVETLYGPGRENEAHDFARNILFDLAHAVGLASAEMPMVGSDLGDEFDAGFVLEEGMILVLEPIVWNDGVASYRAEEIVVVTHDSCRVLSGNPGYVPYEQAPYEQAVEGGRW